MTSAATSRPSRAYPHLAAVRALAGEVANERLAFYEPAHEGHRLAPAGLLLDAEAGQLGCGDTLQPERDAGHGEGIAINRPGTTLHKRSPAAAVLVVSSRTPRNRPARISPLRSKAR
jgi:hypothetical protein